MTIISESRRKQRRRKFKGKSHIAAGLRTIRAPPTTRTTARSMDRNFAEGVIPRRLPKKINDLNATLGRLDLDPKSWRKRACALVHD